MPLPSKEEQWDGIPQTSAGDTCDLLWLASWRWVQHRFYFQPHHQRFDWAFPLNCNRACQENLIDQYLTVVVAHHPKKMPFSADVKYTENCRCPGHPRTSLSRCRPGTRRRMGARRHRSGNSQLRCSFRRTALDVLGIQPTVQHSFHGSVPY